MGCWSRLVIGQRGTVHSAAVQHTCSTAHGRNIWRIGARTCQTIRLERRRPVVVTCDRQSRLSSSKLNRGPASDWSLVRRRCFVCIPFFLGPSLAHTRMRISESANKNTSLIPPLPQSDRGSTSVIYSRKRTFFFALFGAHPARNPC